MGKRQHCEFAPESATLDVERDYERPSPREDLLRETIGLITGDRNNQYGPPTQDFERTAALWNAFGFRFVPHEGAEPRPIVSHQIAIAQELLKVSRKAWMPEKRDSWADTAGYAGCGWECVVAEQEAARVGVLAADEALAALRAKLAGEVE